MEDFRNQKNYVILQGILSRPMLYLRTLLDDYGTAVLSNSVKPEVRIEEREMRVIDFALEMQIDIGSLGDDGQGKLSRSLKENFTSSEVADAFNRYVQIYGMIKLKLGEHISKIHPESVVTPSQLTAILEGVTEEEISAMFGTSKIKGEMIRKLIEKNILTIYLPLEAKQLYGDESESSLRREVEMYKAFTEAGFNTQCTLILVDKNPGFSVLYTIPKNVPLLSRIPNIFDIKQGIFTTLMRELSRLHASGLTHGDLNLSNIGFKDGVIFFDLTHATKLTEELDPVVGDIALFARNLSVAIRRSQLTSDEKKSVINAIEDYMNTMIGLVGLKDVTGLIAATYNRFPVITDVSTAVNIRFHLDSVIELLK